MKKTLLLQFTVICYSLLAGPVPVRAQKEPESNVNSRYTVESAHVTGIDESKLSKALREDMDKLVGEKFNQNAADAIATRIRKELPSFTIKLKLQRGDQPEHIKIVFEAERYWWKKFDIERSRLVYHSKEGWSGELSTTFGGHHNAFTVGYVNSGDELLERNAGFRFGYENRKVFTDRLRVRMSFETYHDQWNPATEFALQGQAEVPGVYRWRQDFSPSLALLAWRDFEISAGTSFERFQTQYPVLHTQAAYAGTASVAFRHKFEPSSGANQRVNLEYSLRSATRALGSDFVYTRHLGEAGYSIHEGRNYFSARMMAGGLTGAAPLFDRFSLGDSINLRGWNKYDVAPLGGSRMVYASLEYHYSDAAIFYDTGAVWDSGQSHRFRHSVGLGFADRHGAFLLLGIPLRKHDVGAVLMFGIRF